MVPGLDRIGGAKMAKTTWALIKIVTVMAREDALSVTANIGVVTHDGTYRKTVQPVVQAADQVVYAAKRAGRNGVRILAPCRAADQEPAA